MEASFRTITTVEFSDTTLGMESHVVSDKFVNTPVIVGTNVLNREGVTSIERAEYKDYLVANLSFLLN